MKQLSAQRLIDIKAILLIAAIAVIIAFIGSSVATIITLRLTFPEMNEGENPAEGILLMSTWITSFVLLMPIWVFLATIIRWLIDRPKGAFARASSTN